MELIRIETGITHQRNHPTSSSSRNLTLMIILTSRSTLKGSPNIDDRSFLVFQLVPTQSLSNPESHQSSHSCPSCPSRHQHFSLRRSARHLLKYEHPSDDLKISNVITYLGQIPWLAIPGAASRFDLHQCHSAHPYCLASIRSSSGQNHVAVTSVLGSPAHA